MANSHSRVGRTVHCLRGQTDREAQSLISDQGICIAQKVNGIPHRLLIVGADLPGTSPFEQVIKSEGLSEQVVVLGYATHEDMVLIYNAADLFVYPSAYEGFGMPVLEAMACGAPVVALNNTSLPEIAGGIAHLLKNADVATLKEGIEAVLGDPAWRERMSSDGPKRAAAYDWHFVTKRYLELMIPLVTSQNDG